MGGIAIGDAARIFRNQLIMSIQHIIQLVRMAMAAAMFAIVQRDEIRRNQRGVQFRRLRPQDGDARVVVVFRLERRTARLDVRHAEQRGFQ